MENTKADKVFIFGVILCVGVFVGAIALGIYFAQSNNLPAPKAQETAVIPSPTPVAKVYKLEVLNGSGISGLAAKMAENYKKLGYEVVKVDTADTRSKTTVINISDAAISDKAKILADFKLTESGSLNSTDFDIQIILGSDFTP